MAEALPPIRVCIQCGVALCGYRRQARYCGGPCRAAASRARIVERSNNASQAREPSVLDESAQKRTDGAWRLATPAEEALAGRLRHRLPELTDTV
jgi:hypothetical protein